MTAGHDTVDVAVVGFGPVGAAVAGLLARRGRRVLVVDRETGLYPLPRAAHLDGEVLRILQELGCADEVLAEVQVNRGMDFLTAGGEVLVHLEVPGGSQHGWPASVLFHQPSVELRLRDAVVAAGASVRLGVAVTGVDPAADDGATEVVRLTLDDGTAATARWVVACDGARSTVRDALGVAMDDLGFTESWLVVDVLVDDDARGALPDRVLQVCDPARPATVVPMPGRRFRFEFMVLPDDDPDALRDPARIDELLAPWLPPGAATLERDAVYTFRGRIAERWRVGRVLLAGDAAHQMPPFLGQGMCSGLRDAANLAWKLDAVLDGAPDALLDSYQSEREPHVRGIVEAAIAFGRIICTTDAEVAAARDADLLAARAAGAGAQSEPPLPALGAGDPSGTSLLGAGGGRPARQVVLAGGARSDDVAGACWAVVLRDPAWRSHPTVTAWAAAGALVWDAASEPTLVALLDAAADDHAGGHTHDQADDHAGGAPVGVAVVRPDRYLHAAVSGPDALGPPPLPRRG